MELNCSPAAFFLGREKNQLLSGKDMRRLRDPFPVKKDFPKNELMPWNCTMVNKFRPKNGNLQYLDDEFSYVNKIEFLYFWQSTIVKRFNILKLSTKRWAFFLI